MANITQVLSDVVKMIGKTFCVQICEQKGMPAFCLR